MPEGIVPELLIFIALVVVVAVVFVVTRRKPPEEISPPPDVAEAPAEERVDATDAIEVEAPIAEPEPVAPVKERPSLRERLGKSRKFLADKLGDVLRGAPDEDTWDDVEAALIQADVGVETASKITEDLRGKAKERRGAAPGDGLGVLGG